ncbi:MAG TPA: alpha/beta hydrolase [Ktedonobacteraceae bacterium]|nr:alpha/beta hydrolase [Ktedonobacteraceae bacterium]
MNASLPPGQTVSINGMQMYFVSYGSGEPLLLLHGFTGSSRDWTMFAPELLEEYQLIIPDLRGHGRSTNRLREFTFRQAALDVFALLDYLGITQCKAIGVSGGGNALLHMATQQPDRIKAMVLVSATSYFPVQARKMMRQFKIEDRTDEEWQFMRQSHKHGEEQIRALWMQGQRLKDSYDDMNFTAPFLSTITASTLLVYGDHDPLYPVHIALEMYTAIARSYLWVIPNAGHSPIFGDLRPSFTRTVLSFLRGEWQQA